MTATRWKWTAITAGFALSACGQSVPQEQVNAVATLVTDDQSGPMPPPPSNTTSPEPSPSPTPTEPTAEQVRAQYSAALQTCLDTGDAAKGVSIAMGACFNGELATQDAQLNAAYKQAMDARAGDDRTALRDHQRAWIRERDAQCREQATGGTIDLVEIPGCLLEETVRRRMALQSLAG